MSYRINFDIETLLGDTANSDFLGVEFLNCYEYNLWQAMRQSGIKDYKAAINTRAFIRFDYEISSTFNIKLAAQNVKTLKENLKKYYGFDFITYQNSGMKSIHEFIVDALHHNKFVYVLYSHYHDTINDIGMVKQKKVHHSTLLTGYDDKRKVYVALVDGRYNVGFQDLDTMYRYFTKLKAETRYFNVFYLSKENETSIVKDDIYADISQDMNNLLLNWDEEINCYQSVINRLKQLECGKESDEYLGSLRVYFYKLRLGFGGNLYFKLKALEEFTTYSFDQYYDKFLENRKKSEVVANMIGKLLMAFSQERLNKTISKIDQVFLKDSYQLKCELAETIKN